MEFKLSKADWEIAKRDNIALIKQCNMQILMAERILGLCEEQILINKDVEIEGDISRS